MQIIKRSNGQVVRNLNLVDNAKITFQYKKYSLYKFKMIKMVLVFFLLLLWTTCFLFIVRKETQSNSAYSNLLNCLYQITNLFFLISNSEEPNVLIMLFEMICLTIGVILQLFFYGKRLKIYSIIYVNLG